jgi:hypothetical protein
LKTVNWVG